MIIIPKISWTLQKQQTGQTHPSFFNRHLKTAATVVCIVYWLKGNKETLSAILNRSCSVLRVVSNRRNESAISTQKVQEESYFFFLWSFGKNLRTPNLLEWMYLLFIARISVPWIMRPRKALFVPFGSLHMSVHEDSSRNFVSAIKGK